MNFEAAEQRFLVHVRQDGIGAGRWTLNAESFVDAAVQFAEIAPIRDEAVSIEIVDAETGASRCFLIDLGKGQIQPC